MIYVFDSGPLIDLFRHFYPKRFPTLWEKFEQSVRDREIVSVSEVFAEIEGHEDRLSAWAKKNREVFQKPSPEELSFVKQIFLVPHFQNLIREKARLQGNPVADPFVIAKAKIIDGCVVTQEIHKPHASGIPNVCEHFDIPCMNLEGFMEKEDWTF